VFQVHCVLFELKLVKSALSSGGIRSQRGRLTAAHRATFIVTLPTQSGHNAESPQAEMIAPFPRA
jgi:hypothetical protein